MSVVVALEKDDVVYMGADTCLSRGKRKDNSSNGEFGKITVLPNGLLVGVVGVVRAKQLLISHSELFSFADQTLTKTGIVLSFLPQVVKLLKENKEMEDDDTDLPISLLLAKDSDLFVVKSSLKVVRVRDFAIGSGMRFTFPSLRDESETIENRLVNAMRIAEKYNTAVGAPFVLTDTKEKSFKEIRK